MFIISCICFNEQLTEIKIKKQREKSAPDFNPLITSSSFQVHIGREGGGGGRGGVRGAEGGGLNEREISRFHLSNFSPLYKDAAGVGSREEILGKY